MTDKIDYRPIVDEDWEYLEGEFGKPRNVVEPTEADYARFSGHVPDSIMDLYWRRFGFCTFEKGRFSIVNPA